MRCRKALSCLSAYSDGELIGRKLAAFQRHVSSCEPCRGEQALIISIRESGRRLAAPMLPDDFNAKLLNRIAQERFSETRTKAFLPRLSPPVGLARIVAAAATVGVVVMAIAGNELMSPDANETGKPSIVMQSDGLGQDDSYLTARPVAMPMRDNWSLDKQLARSERISRISNVLTDQVGFGNHRAGDPADV